MPWFCLTFFIFYVNLIIVFTVPTHGLSVGGKEDFWKMLPGAEWVISLHLGVMIRTWGETLSGRHKQTSYASILWLSNQLPSNVNKTLNISANHGGITDSRDLREKSTNIQNTKEILKVWEDVFLRLNPARFKC